MYDELIKRLKNCATQADPCLTCDMTDDGSCIETLMKQAADAIEELERKENFHAFLWNTIQPNEMEQYLSMYIAQAVPSQPPKEE